MAGKNTNISISFSANKSAQEVNKLAQDLKTLRKEFEISNLSIKATGDTMGLAENKLKGFAAEAKLLRSATAAMQRGLEDASNAQSKLAARVENARKAYESAARSESKSKEEVEKLKKEYDNLSSMLGKADKAVAKWSNKLQDAKLAEGKLQVAVKQTNDSIDKQNKELTKNIENTRNVTSASGKMLNVYSLIRGLAVGYAGKTLFEALIGDNAKLEQSVTAFEVLLGSAESANKRISELTQFAAITPFNLPQVVEAEKRLLAYGVAAQDTQKTLQMLGDISMGNAQKLDMIGLAYGQVITNQKLYGSELRQFAENGVPLLDELAKMYGKTGAEMRKMIEDGQVSSEAVTAALENMTSAGGKFFGMMDKQSQTMSGMWATLTDDIAIFARQAGQEGFEYLKDELSGVIDKLNEMQADGSLDEFAKNVGQDVGRVIIFIGDVVKLLWDMRSVLLATGSAVIAFKVSMAIGGTVMATVSAVKAYNEAVALAKTRTYALNAALGVNPWVLLASAVAAVIVGIIGYNLATKDAADETDKLKKKFDEIKDSYKSSIESSEKSSASMMGQAKSAETLAKKLEELNSKEKLNISEKRDLKSIVDQLNQVLPSLNLQIDEQTGKIIGNTQAIYDNIEALKSQAIARGYQAKADAAGEAYANQEISLGEKRKQLDRAKAELAEMENKYGGIMSDILSGTPVNEAAKKAGMTIQEFGTYDSVIYKFESKKNEIQGLIKDIAEQTGQLIKYEDELDEYLKKATETAPKGTTTTQTKSPPPLTSGKSKSGNDVAKKEYEDLKFARDMGYITEREYYIKLAALRDKYYKKGSSEWQQYTLEIKKGLDDLAKKEKDTAHKAYEDRRKASDKWLAEQKEIGKLSTREEIAGYERIKAYTKEYYDKGIISYEEYIDTIKELDKNISKAQKSEYEQRRANSDKWLAEKKEAGTLTIEEEIAGYERIKAYTKQYYEQGIISYEEYISRIKELDKNISNAQKNEYKERRKNSDNWVEDKKFYSTISIEEEIAGYERIKDYTKDYYEQGIISYEEYQEAIRELDKKIYSARKKRIEEDIKNTYDAEKKKLDAQKKAIESKYDDLDRADRDKEREKELAELQRQEAIFQNAATKEGKKRLERIQDDIAKLEKEKLKEQREIDKKSELDELQSKYDELDEKQKKLLDNINEYAMLSAGTLEQATLKIQNLLKVLSNANLSMLPGAATNNTTYNINQTNNNNITDRTSANIFGNYISSGFKSFGKV